MANRRNEIAAATPCAGSGSPVVRITRPYTRNYPKARSIKGFHATYLWTQLLSQTGRLICGSKQHRNQNDSSHGTFPKIASTSGRNSVRLMLHAPAGDGKGQAAGTRQ
jgi:hypothetical protein